MKGGAKRSDVFLMMPIRVTLGAAAAYSAGSGYALPI